ncbi:hypothetical protein AAZV13_18G052466 [Glycine max]
MNLNTSGQRLCSSSHDFTKLISKNNPKSRTFPIHDRSIKITFDIFQIVLANSETLASISRSPNLKQSANFENKESSGTEMMSPSTEANQMCLTSSDKRIAWETVSTHFPHRGYISSNINTLLFKFLGTGKTFLQARQRKFLQLGIIFICQIFFQISPESLLEEA